MLKLSLMNCDLLIRRVLLMLMAGILIQGCARLNISKVTYNPVKQVYEYSLPGMDPVVLRTNSGELVTEDNFETFMVEQSLMDYNYPFDDRAELAGPPKEADYRIASLYAESVHRIKEENFSAAAETIEQLEKTYPEAVYYSDVAFLRGYIQEKLGQDEEAKRNYDTYLAFSSGKFSDRFRNYKHADPNDKYWLQQRAYAADFLAGRTPRTDTDFLKEITPKYFFTSLQPGFTMNAEGLEGRPRGIFSIALGKDLSSDLSGGFQYYRNLIDGMDINPEFSISRNMWELRMAVPIQLYRAENNRFGIKVSPYGHYSKINTFRSGGSKIDVGESVLNYGVKSSMGFFIVQRLSLGAYYTWNYYNAGRPFSKNEHLPDLWWDNEYDVSLYYPLINGLNLKAGMKSGDWVAGFYLPGWEISYNINEGNIILRTEMY